MLERCVCVDLHGVRGIDIVQFELQVEAVRAADHIVSVCLCPPRHVSDAVSANVVRAAGRDEDCIEIPKANWTVILEFVLELLFGGIVIDMFDVLLIDLCLDSNLVTRSNLGKLLLCPLDVVKLLVKGGKLVIVVNF